jgi:hypothetical protein
MKLVSSATTLCMKRLIMKHQRISNAEMHVLLSFCVYTEWIQLTLHALDGTLQQNDNFANAAFYAFSASTVITHSRCCVSTMRKT